MADWNVTSAQDMDQVVKGHLTTDDKGVAVAWTPAPNSDWGSWAFEDQIAAKETIPVMSSHMRTLVFAPRELTAPSAQVAKEDVAIDVQPGDIVKVDPKKQLVFGWAYITHDKDGQVNIDKSGDFADNVEEIEKTAYDYVLRSRQGDADHTNVAASTMVESVVFTPEKIEKMGLPAGVMPLGWWVGFKVEDPATWARVEKGELKAFSVHGKGTRSKVQE